MDCRSARSRSDSVALRHAPLLAPLALLLGGCVAQVRVAAPPPPPAPEVTADVDTGTQVDEAPPPLPDYDQPPCPAPGYLWTPGYWAFAGGYYWVPGTWVYPPRVGVLWTPGYWGFVGGAYLWHVGYWGPHVGFYGGVNYGFGYGGVGFFGGRWVGNSFAYNRAVVNVNVTVIHNTYNETVVRNVYVNRTSFNGPGGVAATPTREEQMAAREQHFSATAIQQRHVQQASQNPSLFARANGGRPSIAATPRPAAFNAPGVIHARGAAQTGVQAERPQFQSQERGGTAASPNGNSARPQFQANQRPAGQNNAARNQNPKPGKAHPKAKPHPKKAKKEKESDR